MSAPVEAIPMCVETPAPASLGVWKQIDRALQWAGDHLNPILVKEARQALKSRQFLVTFSLLLVCAWIWTFMGVAIAGPDIYYTAQGTDLFIGYYFMLAFALFVIVPFGAFRSLAAEQEDRTFGLLSITTLNPRQIVSGKLGSAVLQMLIYLSSITPCLAFTYMLRGIDLPSILIILFYSFLGSLGLSVLAILAATISTERHWQVVYSVLLLVGLLFALWMGMAATVGTLTEMTGMFHWDEFWPVNGGIISAYGGYFLLCFFAAAAQLTFSTDNRATRLRIVMLGQQLVFIGWIAWMWIALSPRDGDGFVMVTFIVLGVHWYAMGALMTGESPQLSSRVTRNLPQSFLGRMFLTWFNPGPGTGYMFALANMLGAMVLGLGALVVVEMVWASQWGRAMKIDTCAVVGGVMISYLAFYLGLGLLLVRLLRKFAHVPLFLTLLLQVLLLMLFTFVPLIIHMMSPGLRHLDYMILHVLNPFWTMTELADRPLSGSSLWGVEAVYIVPILAMIVFVLNLPSVAREVARVRIDRPKRVAEEDAHLEAARVPAPAPLSPWD
jgi:hypothetical protein